MIKFVGIALVAVGMMASAAQADVFATNGSPTPGWNYGTGNNYAPSNTTTLTTNNGSQLDLRMHKTYDAAPASDANGVYSFALGTDPVSFDWGIYNTTGSRDILGVGASLLTITNVGTGASWSYDPFFVGNDDTNGAGYAQNSFRLNWALGGVNFDPNVDDTYKVNLTVNGMDGGTKSLDVYAKMGAGAVPEPATWAMMVLGFGALGASLRKKQASVARRALA